VSDGFPDFIKALPEPDSPLDMRANIVPNEYCMPMFYEIDQDVDVPEHVHGAQWGVVLEGEMEMTIGGETRTYRRGDTYTVPAGVTRDGLPVGLQIVGARHADADVLRFAAAFDAHRPQAHDLGVQGRHAAGHDAGERRDAQLCGALAAGDEHGGGTVVQRAAVAGGHRAVGAECRQQVGEAFHGRSRPDAVVGLKQPVVGQRVGGDLPLEETAVQRLFSPVLGTDAPLVLALTADAGRLHHILGFLAHGDVDVGESVGRGPSR